MAALTWQNVNGPQNDLRDIRGTTNDIFSGLQGLLGKAQATDTANWDQTKLNNTNALLAGVQEAQTPEEYAVKRAALQQQIAGYGAQVDAVAARTAMDNRLSTLQQRATADITYKHTVEDERTAPLKEQLRQAYLDKNATAVQALTQQLNGARGSAEVGVFGRGIQDADVARTTAATKLGFDVNKDARETLMAPIERRAKEASIIASNAAAGASGASARHSDASTILAQGQETDRRAATASAIRNASAQALLKGTVYEGGVWTGRDAVEGRDILSKIDSTGFGSGEINKIMERLSQIDAAGGVNVQGHIVPLPKDLVKGILASANDKGWGEWNNGGVDYFNAALKKALEATVPGGSDGNGVPRPDRSPMLDGYQALLAGQHAAVTDPLPPGKGGTGSPKPSGEYKSPKPAAHPGQGKDHKK